MSWTEEMLKEQQRVLKKQSDRISELKKVVNNLTTKLEYNSEGYCLICDAYHLQSHGDDCEFLKARAVLEGK